MGGGLMQLVAYGAQDVYLTGNAQITLFKVVYRRHTNFSSETIELPIETAKPSGRVSVQVLRNADLASKSYLRLTVPDLEATNNFNGKVAWVRRVGHAAIKTVEVQIGGSLIDKHYGVWLDLWYELTHEDNQSRGYSKLVGDVPELTTLQDTVAGGQVLLVPLQFWFCRNYGLALPLIALQYHEVRINIEFERVENLVVFTAGDADSTPKFNGLSFGSSGILVDYIYLDSEERRRFAQVGHEYLIEQVQLNEQNLQNNSTNQQFTLNFNHPCKELIWAHRCGAFNGVNGSQFLGYTNADNWSEVLTEVAGVIAQNMWNNGNGTTGSSVNGTTTITAGGVNVDVTADDSVDICVNPFALGANSWNPVKNISAVTFANGLVTSVTHTLTVADISLPVSSSANANDVTGLVSVVQLNNYGLALDGTGNMVTEGNLVLNGHDRFDKREGAWFNYLQPGAHTHTPADGVNVFCFGLHPEQHQPTGTMNASRIDSLRLVYKVADTLASSRGGQFDFSTGTVVYIFVTNYNVLRIMSGMGGLAYSN